MKKKTANIITALLVAVIAVCLVIILRHIWIQQHNAKIYDHLETEAVKPKDTEVVSETTEQTEKADEIPIDFQTLWDTNPDIYAWIEIPGTEVSYPVLRKEGDDNYYLDTTVEGNSGLPGSIYSQASYNTADFTDFNTILYGHDMKNGSMFGSLKNYKDSAYWQEHPEVVIYTPDKKLVYRIFAAVVYSDDLIPYAYDLESESGRQSFLDSVYGSSDSRSMIDSEIPVDTDSRLLTLSTCISGESNHRYLVIGVLENE